ncbi:hypothetical protein HNQ81_002984 [Desulfoprunum benzoelyticum]|uniref:Uncharacterized protein n=1 Tax=Desulfoprunum benzoelyticum TaxID=1506996 RepID=A0A840UTW1_9BACT|nr:hypothetical protein [Desulfoprunum benzoelyticum]
MLATPHAAASADNVITEKLQIMDPGIGRDGRPE